MKKFIQTAILIGVSATISFLFVFLIVQADWTPPTETAPACSLTNPACNTPINIGESPQTKSGNLGVGGYFIVGGNVGIGIIDVSKYALNVNGDINIASGKKLYIGGEPAIFSNWTRDDTNKYLYSTNADYKVGIGTNVPGAKLDVAGSAVIKGGDITAQPSYTTNWVYEPGSVSDGHSGDRCVNSNTNNKVNCDTNSGIEDCGNTSYDIGPSKGTAQDLCYDWFYNGIDNKNQKRAYNLVQPSTLGGRILAQSGYGDTISLGGDSGGDDLEIKINAPLSRNTVSFWNQNSAVDGAANIAAGKITGTKMCLEDDTNCISSWSNLPTGASGQTLRYDGANWIANSNIFNDGTNVGIGINTPNQTLHILGNIRIAGVTGNPDTATLLIGSGDSDNIPSFPTIPCSTDSYSASLCGSDDANVNVNTALNSCPDDKPATTGSKNYNDVAKGSTVIGGAVTDAWFKRTITCVNPDEPLYKMKNIGGNLVFENNSGAQTLKVGKDGAVTMGPISNSFVLDSAGNVSVAGHIKIVDGSQGLDKVLTSDASGLASWQPPSVGGGVIDHGALTGLTDDNAHTQYLLTSGTRAMTGALKMSATENDITNVKSIIGYNDLFIKSDSSELTPIYYGASKHSFYIGGEEKTTINSNGLHVLGSARDQILVEGNNEYGTGIIFRNTHIDNNGEYFGLDWGGSTASNRAGKFGFWYAGTDVGYDKNIMTLTKDGYVGIGTTSPGIYKLKVDGTVGITGDTTVTGGIDISGELVAHNSIHITNSLPLVFYPGNKASNSIGEWDKTSKQTDTCGAANIDTDGNGKVENDKDLVICTGLNTVSKCDDRAHVIVATTIGGVTTSEEYDATRSITCVATAGVYSIKNEVNTLYFINGAGANTFAFDQTGAAFASSWNTVSDLRLKTGIAPLESSLNKILSLQGVNFEWKDNLGKKQIGFIAQDVEKIIPELVHTDTNGMKSLSYDKLTAVIVEAIKELKAENNSLKARIEKLENK